MALIDTGANNSCIDDQTARHNGFRSVGDSPLNTASGSGTTAVYPGLLEILDIPGHKEQLQLLGFQGNLREDLIALIGADILNKGRLVYDGPAQTFTLEL